MIAVLRPPRNKRYLDPVSALTLLRVRPQVLHDGQEGGFVRERVQIHIAHERRATPCLRAHDDAIDLDVSAHLLGV